VFCVRCVLGSSVPVVRCSGHVVRFGSCGGDFVMCVWDYVIRVSEADLIFLFGNVVAGRGA
jgi:hypothetical protein